MCLKYKNGLGNGGKNVVVFIFFVAVKPHIHQFLSDLSADSSLWFPTAEKRRWIPHLLWDSENSKPRTEAFVCLLKKICPLCYYYYYLWALPESRHQCTCFKTCWHVCQPLTKMCDFTLAKTQIGLKSTWTINMSQSSGPVMMSGIFLFNCDGQNNTFILTAWPYKFCCYLYAL